MRILICTQVLDKNHPLLGFFHRWIEEFAKQCESVIVVPLYAGEYDLPENVTVLSLGKERSANKLLWLWRLLTISWSKRHEYDATFVHMTPIQMAIMGWLWRLLGKRNGLWYTHPSVDAKLRMATFFTHAVFTGSESSFRIKSPKKNVMGQGVDETFYIPKEDLRQRDLQLLVVGRVSPIKNVKIAIEVIAQVKDAYDATLHIVGGPGEGTEDQVYLDSLHELARQLQVESNIIWHGPKNSTEVRDILADNDVFLHTSLTHSADKTLPEAMAAGLFVISSNQAYQEDLPSMCFKEPEAKQYVDSIHEFMRLSVADQNTLRHKLRRCVEEKHSLKRLISNILALY